MTRDPPLICAVKVLAGTLTAFPKRETPPEPWSKTGSPAGLEVTHQQQLWPVPATSAERQHRVAKATHDRRPASGRAASASPKRNFLTRWKAPLRRQLVDEAG